MSAQSHLQRFDVDRTLINSYGVLLNYADAFFNNHLSKRVQIELAPGFALARAIVAVLPELRSSGCKRLHSLTRRYSSLH